jgi:hypothetical protein
MTYETGRGKPPKKTRFKKGKSGNPSGRPRRNTSLAALVEADLASTVTVQEAGKTRKISKKKALSKRVVAAAINGDPKAIAMLLQIAKSAPAANENEVTPPSEYDLEVVRRFAPRILKERESKK